MSQLDRYINSAGAGAVLMVAEGDTLEDVRRNTPGSEWRTEGNRTTYRGAYVEVHDEWSWGWMVRRADGTYVSRAEAEAA